MVQVINFPTQFLKQKITNSFLEDIFIKVQKLVVYLDIVYTITLTLDLLISWLALYNLLCILLILNSGWYCISFKNLELLLDTGYRLKSQSNNILVGIGHVSEPKQ